RRTLDGHESFISKVAIAALAAATGAATAEAVKRIPDDRPATPTVVIIETDRQAALVKNSPTVYSVSKEKPAGDPPKQSGRYVILDKDENVLEEKAFDLPTNLYSDMIIKAVDPTGVAKTAVPWIIEEPDQTSENSSSLPYVPTPYVIDDADAVKLTIRDE